MKIDVSGRKILLKRLYAEIFLRQDEIALALKQDFNKNEFDSYATEVGIVLEEIRHAIRHLSGWAKIKRVGVSLKNIGGHGLIYPEPYGKVLIIAPWNYPFQLSLVPLVGAIAAGNSVILKPSSQTKATFNIIKSIIENVFVGGEAVTTGSRDILEQKFDYIFFTGGEKTGRAVAIKAAQNLTPYSLELGGKSPAIVDEGANVLLAAKRLAWGKFLNAGQTCVAPDYICVHSTVAEQFTSSFISQIKSQYYSGGTLTNEFCYLINSAKGEQVQAMLKGEKILFGGEIEGRQMSPTVINATFDSPCMQEEVFAPLAPIIIFENFDELADKICQRSKPLALYYFGKNKESALKIPFGGGCLNDTVMHVSESSLPFGGVGNSGNGAYHGYNSFATFTHFKSVLVKGALDIKTRYAPHTPKALAFLKKVEK